MVIFQIAMFILSAFLISYILHGHNDPLEGLLVADRIDHDEEMCLDNYLQHISAQEELDRFHNRLLEVADSRRNRTLTEWHYFLWKARQITSQEQYELYVLSAEIETGLPEHEILFPSQCFILPESE